jgi:AcrR family transcriptional regulator
VGLRETKKHRVHEAIIENAIALFRDHGFEATTVKEISRACELSEATFFNYFSTKDAVLSAWAHAVVERELELARDSAGRGLRSIARRLCDSLGSTIEADRDFAARAWVRARLSGSSPDAAAAILKAGQEAGELRRDLSARQLGGIFYASLCGTVAAWLARDEPRGPLAADLRRASDLILDGARRRTERVRPRKPAVPGKTNESVRPGPSPSTR